MSDNSIYCTARNRYPVAAFLNVTDKEFGTYVNKVLTDAEADALFRSDLNIAEDAVRKNTDFALTQNQFDALTDFAFNIGAQHFADSYTLKLLNSQSQFGDLIYAEGIWRGAFGNGDRRRLEIEFYNKPGV